MKTNLLTKIASSVLFVFLFNPTLPDASAAQIDIVGPVGSGSFGTNVTVLPNGNFVVTDPGYDAPGPIVNVGAVYLYDGATLGLISTLTGSTANDAVGNRGVTVLSNGNFVVSSTAWSSSRGAVTWGSATVGVSGEVSSVNSIIGSIEGDQVGNGGMAVLTNGNYVIRSVNWDNGAVIDAGAATWCNGTVGTVGIVSAANSLVGSSANDQIGFGSVTALNNGNYVVRTLNWDNGAVVNAGAVTWGSGLTGVVGVVSAGNSLVGSAANDRVGAAGMTVLNNGNYVVLSPSWKNGAGMNVGAITWGSGTVGVSGTISSANSLVGSSTSDLVGNFGVIALSNGNYVVSSTQWNGFRGAVTWGNGAIGTVGEVSVANSLVGSAVSDLVGSGVIALNSGNYVVSSTNWNGSRGAATWGNGLGGTVGAVSSANSLVGSTANDNIGIGITALANGHYVVRSPYWDNGAVIDSGAVTWGSDLGATVGTVSAANSLVGSTASDGVGTFVIALSNGNYVVGSAKWDNAAVIDAGAVTWGNGLGGTVGVVSAANSLVGSTAGDQAGFVSAFGPAGVVALANGNYVVISPAWDSGAMIDAGAVTWGDGTAGTSGAVSMANSLVGGTPNEKMGTFGVGALANGNYLLFNPLWDDGTKTDVGAVTWGNGLGGTIGTVSAANSFIGSTANDKVSNSVAFLKDGNYVLRSPNWDNGATVDAGATTWCDSTVGTTGVVTTANSVLGTVAGGGATMNFTYDLLNARLIVGYPAANRVSLFTYRPIIDIEMVSTGIRLRFSGAPGRTYNIERAPAVTGPWGTNASPIAPISGLIEYIDTSALPGSAFYRISTP